MSITSNTPLFEAVDSSAYVTPDNLDELKGEDLFNVVSSLDATGGLLIHSDPSSKRPESSLAFKLDYFFTRLDDFSRDVVICKFFEVDPENLSISALIRLKRDED